MYLENITIKTVEWWVLKLPLHQEQNIRGNHGCVQITKGIFLWCMKRELIMQMGPLI